MIIRRDIQTVFKRLVKDYPVVTITGPRQSGKTTLARTTFPDIPYFSMEDPDIRAMALADPRSFLENDASQVILDEIQRAPQLLSYIQGIVDEPHSVHPRKFILTGSYQLEMIGKVVQSLAGRTALLRLLPFTFGEVHRFGKKYSVNDFLIRGFYPRVYRESLDPTTAYKYYFETYVQRDLRQLITIKDLRLFQKFVRLCAGRAGRIFVASSLSNEVGVSVPTIHSWISVLEASSIIFLLEPYHENIGKRLVKSPKLYFHDVGLASYLLGIENEKQMERDPARGGLVENLVVSELVKNRFNAGKDHNLFFYRDSNNNEVDIIFKTGTMLVPAEVKSAATFTADFLKGLDYLKKIFPGRIEKSYLVYCGKQGRQLGNVQLIAIESVREIVDG